MTKQRYMPTRSQADRMGDEVGRKVQRLVADDSLRIKRPRASGAVAAAILFFLSPLAVGQEMVRYSGETRRVVIKNSTQQLYHGINAEVELVAFMAKYKLAIYPETVRIKHRVN